MQAAGPEAAVQGPVADAEKSPQAGKAREEGKSLNPVGSLDNVPFATLTVLEVLEVSSLGPSTGMKNSSSCQ